MPERVARRPVFTLADRMFSWADLVALAQLDGAWADVEKAAHSGIAGLRRAEAENRRPTSDEIAEAATRFRYARNLLAGEQLIEWLEHWQLPPADWRAYVERELVREPSAACSTSFSSRRRARCSSSAGTPPASPSGCA